MARKGNLQVVTPFSANLPPPPKALTPESQKFWTEVTTAYDLDEAGLQILRLSCEALDTARSARQIVQKEGLVIRLRGGGQKAHPAVGIERDARLSAIRALRELALDIEPADVRPPRGSMRRGR